MGVAGPVGGGRIGGAAAAVGAGSRILLVVTMSPTDADRQGSVPPPAVQFSSEAIMMSPCHSAVRV